MVEYKKELSMLEDNTLVLCIPVNAYGDIDKKFKEVTNKHKRLSRISKMFYGKNKAIVKDGKTRTLIKKGRYKPVKIRLSIDKKDKSLYRYVLLLPTHIPNVRSSLLLDINLKYLKGKWSDLILTSVSFPDITNGKELTKAVDSKMKEFYEEVGIPTIHILE